MRRLLSSDAAQMEAQGMAKSTGALKWRLARRKSECCRTRRGILVPVEGQCKVWADNCLLWGWHKHKSTQFPMSTHQVYFTCQENCPRCQNMLCQFYSVLAWKVCMKTLASVQHKTQPCLTKPLMGAAKHQQLLPKECFQGCFTTTDIFCRWYFPSTRLPCGTTS